MSTRTTIITVFVLGMVVGAVLLFMLLDQTQPERLDNLRVIVGAKSRRKSA